MNLVSVFRVVSILFCLSPFALQAQALPTASRDLDVHLLAGFTTGPSGFATDRNTSFTAALTFGRTPYRGIAPSFEVRANKPLQSGNITSEQTILGGMRFTRGGMLRYYANILVGRGQLLYPSGGVFTPNGNVYYVKSWSNVYSPGLGAEIHSRQLPFSIHADIQLQRWSSPVAASGHVVAMPLTVGIAYELPYLKHGHPY